MTLILYNGANSDQAADLDDGVTAAIARGGWPQKGPKPLTSDLWDDVEETVVVRLLTDSNAIYSTLMLLARRAEEVQSPTHKDHLNPAAWVIVKAKTPGEFAPRWALVKDIRVEKLDPAHYRADGRLALEVKFVREGTWRGIEPGGTAHDLHSANVSFLEPIDIDLRFENFGDALPLTTFSLQTFCYNDVALARFEAWDEDSAEPEFAPYLWATTLISTAYNTLISGLSSPFSATQLPGGYCQPLQTVGHNHLWAIPLTDYTGTFTVYGLYQKNPTGSATMRLLHGWQNSPDYEQGELITLPITTTTDGWYILPLGTVKIPSSGERIFGQTPASDGTMGTYRIGVYGYASTANNAYFGGLLMVPQANYPPQVCNSFGNGVDHPTTVASGEILRTFWLDEQGRIAGVNGRPPDGPYQSLEPGRVNRLHMIPLPSSASSAAAAKRFPAIATNWNVSITAIPRWQYLRGGQ